MNVKLLDSFRSNVRPPAKLHPADWIEENVYVARAGARVKYKNSVTPWWREIYGWIPNNNLKGVCVVGFPGSGKSTLIEGSVSYLASEETGNILFVAKDEGSLKDELDGGIIPTLENCEALKHLLPEKHARRKEMIRLAHKIIYARPANEAGLQEVSVRWILGDEPWLWTYAQAFEHLNSRRHDRWNARTMLFAQAGDHGSNWHKQCEIGDQYHWSWQCAGCGLYHPYKWNKELKYDTVKKGTAYDWDEIKKSVRIICPNDGCNREYLDSDRNRRALCDSARYVCYDGRDSSWRTAYVNALTKYSIPWFELVKQWLRARDRAKTGNKSDQKTFITQRLSEWDNPKRERSAIQRSAYSLTDYMDGQKWEREHCRVMTIDRQASGYWAVIRAWTITGESRCLWAGQVASENQLDTLQAKYSVPEQWVYMDFSYLPQKSAKLCFDRGWCGIRGDKGAIRGYRISGDNGENLILYVNPELNDVDTGNSEDFCPEMVIASDPISDMLDNLRNKQGLTWEVPRDLPEEYFQHMGAEEKVLEGGKWKWKDFGRDNHLWDCEKYQIGFAVMMGLFGQKGETDSGDKARG